MCTETKDARVHCTILNDHTNRGRTPPTGEAGPDRPQRQHTPHSNERAVLSGPNSVPPTPPPNGQDQTVRCFHFFSSNPLPPPHRSTTGPAQGGTGALHPHHHGTQNIRLRTPHGEVFGEAP